MLDHDGNPLVVSAIVLYKIVDTFRAAIEIADIEDLIYTKAEATLKHVIGQYPYESNAGTCLRRDVRRTCIFAVFLSAQDLLFSFCVE